MEAFQVMQLLGRWIYLTRITLAAQAVHSVATLAVVMGSAPQLCQGVHSVAVFVSVLGMFVTSQFFLLVASHPDFHKQCLYWSERGTPYQVSCLAPSI